MFKRLLAAVSLIVVLCACQESKPSDQALVVGGGMVKVLSSSYVSTGDSANTLSGGGVVYLVSKIEVTNTSNVDFVPIVEHFFLQDRNGTRYSGVDSGSYALAGISNDLSAIKPGEKRTLTIAFRGLANTQGQILYEY